MASGTIGLIFTILVIFKASGQQTTEQATEECG
jgi:hypothetical protein